MVPALQLRTGEEGIGENAAFTARRQLDVAIASGLTGSFLCFGEKHVRERAEDAVSLESGQAFGRIVVAPGLYDEFVLRGRGATSKRGREDDRVKECGKGGGLEATAAGSLHGPGCAR